MWSGKTEGEVYNFPKKLIFKTCQSAQKIMSRPLKHDVMFFPGVWELQVYSIKPVLGKKKVYGREKSK